MKNNERGITLVEVIIAALLLVLVLFATFGLYERGVFTWGRGERTADLRDHLRIALNTLGADIREARGLTYLDPAKSVPTPLNPQPEYPNRYVKIQVGSGRTNLVALELVPIQSYSAGTGDYGKVGGVALPGNELVSVCYSWAPTSSSNKPPYHVLRNLDGKIDKEPGRPWPDWKWRGSPQPIAHHITYLRISSPDPDKPQLVKVELRAEGEHRGQPVEVEMQGTFHMRAAP